MSKDHQTQTAGAGLLRKLSFLDRYLTLWMFLAMGAGLGKARRLHWRIQDPASNDPSLSRDEMLTRFRSARDQIQKRLEARDVLAESTPQVMTGEETLMSGDSHTNLLPPEWAFTFHGHRCPFMPLGYRMGVLALEALGVSREADHTLHVICELGEGHPQTCLMDGIQAATGATFGKTLMEKTSWGKLAATFWHPGKTAVRYALKAAFLDEFGKLEFFAYRKRGVEPSRIPSSVTQEAIDWTLSMTNEAIYAIQQRPELQYQPPKGSFSKTLCSKCGEYVFERYVRLQDGGPVCIPCSGYQR